MKEKQCGVCLQYFPSMWKAKTKTEPQKCKSCAMKNATPISNYRISTKSAVEDTIEFIGFLKNDIKQLKPIKNKLLTREGKEYLAKIKHVEAKKPKDDKSIPELLKLATIVFNKWIRQRDKHHNRFICICCNSSYHETDMDAAHYMSAGSYSASRFNENNVHGCCIYCNRFLEGNLEAYRVNLIGKIGLTNVELLEKTPRYGHKWERSELMDIITKYK